jgi:hypothetical protein
LYRQTLSATPIIGLRTSDKAAVQYIDNGRIFVFHINSHNN